MAFVRFACFLLIALPVTSLSIMKFHQEDKDAAQELDLFASIEKELLSNNIIGGRRLGVKGHQLMESSKILGGGSELEKISKMVFSSSSNGEGGKKKKKKISRLERKKLSNGSAVYSADYLTHMHHPPKHN